MKLYHGCKASDCDSIMRSIEVTHRGFFMTPDIDIAKAYGNTVICFEVGNFECDISTINKTGNPHKDLNSGLEYVIRNHSSIVSFYKNLEDLYII